MPDSDASGESVLEEPVDTDRINVPVPPPGDDGQDFDYLLGDDEQAVVDESGDGDGPPAAPENLDFAPVAYEDGWEYAPAGTPHDERPFDAFNANTWRFKPAPPPWYQASSARLAIAAVVIALVALVVAVVLLAFRGPSENTVPSRETSTAPATSTPTTVTARTSALPPPPPPPPPPPEPAPAGGGGGGGQRVEPRQTKKPEINVTRNPLSVRPQPRGQG